LFSIIWCNLSIFVFVSVRMILTWCTKLALGAWHNSVSRGITHSAESAAAGSSPLLAVALAEAPPPPPPPPMLLDHEFDWVK
jgi:hypothetical protein